MSTLLFVILPTVVTPPEVVIGVAAPHVPAVVKVPPSISPPAERRATDAEVVVVEAVPVNDIAQTDNAVEAPVLFFQVTLRVLLLGAVVIQPPYITIPYWVAPKAS